MPGRLSFVQITVANISVSEEWYRNVLGMTPEHRDSVTGFVLLHSPTGRIALQRGQPTPGTILFCAEVDNIEQELPRLTERGVQVEQGIRTSPEGYRRILPRDPDQYQVSLYDWAMELGSHDSNVQRDSK